MTAHPPSASPPSGDHPTRAKRAPRRTRVRRLLTWFAAAAAVIVVGLFFGRNAILDLILESELTRLTGGDVRLRDVAFDGLREVRITSIDIDAPNWDGPSANVLRIDGIRAKINPWAWLGAGPSLTSLVADTVRLRLAERRDDPTVLNIMSLEPAKPEAGGDRKRRSKNASLPFGSIEIIDLEVETGIADGERYELIGTSSFRATVDPVPGDPSVHTFFLASLDETVDQIDLAKGTLDASTGRFELRIDDVDLERGTSLALPTAARSIVEAMQISGSVRSAMVEWTPGEVPRAELSIGDLSLIPPPIADLKDAWVTFDDGRIIDSLPNFPRIELQHGRITIDGDILEVRGDGGRIAPTSGASPLPKLELDATLRVRLNAIPEKTDDLAAWGERMLDSAPFEATVRIIDFERRDAERDRPIELPRVIAEALELLRAESWKISANARATRGSLYEEATDFDDDVHVRANLDIHDGRGMYREFAYPLHAVNATLAIEDDVIRIDALRGLGPSDDVVELAGVITGTSDDAGVDLVLSSESIHLDDDLLQALPPSTEKGLRTLFDQTAAERMAAADLIPPPDFYATLPDRIAEDEARMLAARADGEDLDAARLADRIRANRTMLRNGPFEVGGRGAIELRIHRPRVLGHPVAVEGVVDLFKVGAVFSRFPYPLIVTSGTLNLEDLAVRVDAPGLQVNTLFGGEGDVTGRVDLPRDGKGSRDVEPDLELRIDGDRLHDCLLAAVPPELDGRPSPETIPGWPGTVFSPAVDSVRAMGLTGILDYVVDISTDASGDARFEVLGKLREGTADPNEAAEIEVAEAGLLWPRDFALTDVQAILLVDDEHLSLQTFSGQRGPGLVTARGIYDFETEIGRGIARLRNLEVESYLLDLVPAGTIEDAKELWSRWRPTGRFDADLRWNRRDGLSDLDLEAEPLWAAFDTEVGRTRIDCERGRLKFGDEAIEVIDLALALGDPASPQGALRLAGSYGLAPEAGELMLEGILDAGRFEAAAVDEVLRLVTGESFSSWWRGRAPRGGFTGGFELRSGIRTTVALDLVPTSFSMLSREGDPDSRCGGTVTNGGGVAVDDRRVRIGPIELLSDDGAKSRFDLFVPDVDTPDVEATFVLELPSSDLPETGFLPPPFSSFFGEDGASATDITARGAIRATYQDANGEMPADPSIPSFYVADGAMTLRQGLWTIGGVDIEFEPDESGFRMALEAVDGVPTMFDLSGTLPEIRVAGRPVTGTRVEGRLDPMAPGDRPWFEIDAAHGSIGDGELGIAAKLEFETGRYQTRLIANNVDLDSIARTEPETTSSSSAGRLPGILSARVDLGGLVDEPESRVGRGRVTIRDAVLTDGGSLALLQIGQLVPPIADELAVATADFWINRDMLDLENVTLEAETLTLAGQGEMRLNDWQWSIRLLPRGTVPALSDLVSAISGTLAAVDVTGTPNDPQVNLTPLPLVVPRTSFERIAAPTDIDESDQEHRP